MPRWRVSQCGFWGEVAADQLMQEFSAYPRAGVTLSQMCADHRDGFRDHWVPEVPPILHAHRGEELLQEGRTCDREDSTQFFLEVACD